MIDTYYYFKNKYIDGNFNTNFLSNFLLDERYIDNHRKELYFRIGQLSPVQYLMLFNEVIFKKQFHELEIPIKRMELSQDNLDLFFSLENRYSVNELPIYKLNCDHFWWSDIMTFSEEFDSASNERSIKRFESECNKLINKFSQEIISNLSEYKAIDKEVPVQKIDSIIKIFEYLKEYKVNLPVRFGMKDMFDGESYDINLSTDKQMSLYKSLTRFDLIDNDRTSFIDWSNVLTKKMSSHKSIIYFKMNNPQFNFFLNEFEKRFRVNLTIKKIEKMGNIFNKNGRIKSNSLYVSVNRNKSISDIPKGGDQILGALNEALKV